MTHAREIDLTDESQPREEYITPTILRTLHLLDLWQKRRTGAGADGGPPVDLIYGVGATLMTFLFCYDPVVTGDPARGPTGATAYALVHDFKAGTWSVGLAVDAADFARRYAPQGLVDQVHKEQAITDEMIAWLNERTFSVSLPAWAESRGRKLHRGTALIRVEPYMPAACAAVALLMDGACSPDMPEERALTALESVVRGLKQIALSLADRGLSACSLHQSINPDAPAQSYGHRGDPSEVLPRRCICCGCTASGLAELGGWVDWYKERNAQPTTLSAFQGFAEGLPLGITPVAYVTPRMVEGKADGPAWVGDERQWRPAVGFVLLKLGATGAELFQGWCEVQATVDTEGTALPVEQLVERFKQGWSEVQPGAPPPGVGGTPPTLMGNLTLKPGQLQSAFAAAYGLAPQAAEEVAWT
jgi:hypothetical protein